VVFKDTRFHPVLKFILLDIPFGSELSPRFIFVSSEIFTQNPSPTLISVKFVILASFIACDTEPLGAMPLS